MARASSLTVGRVESGTDGGEGDTEPQAPPDGGAPTPEDQGQGQGKGQGNGNGNNDDPFDGIFP